MKKIIILVIIIFLGILGYGYYQQKKVQICGTGLIDNSFLVANLIQSAFYSPNCPFETDGNF